MNEVLMVRIASGLRLALLALAALPATGQNQAWIRQLGTALYDEGRAAAPDGIGGVFVSGHTAGNVGGLSAGGHDVWLAHFDAGGIQLWIRQFGSNASEEARSAVSDGSGGVYVSGFTEGDIGAPNVGGQDVWLARYDGAGLLLWARQFGSGSLDVAHAAASDGAGGVFIAGSTDGIIAGASAGSRDGWLARYDSAGNRTLVRQLGTIQIDEVRAAAPDGAGGVYVSGFTAGSLTGPYFGGTYDSWLARYDGAGNLIWVRQFGSNSFDVAHAAATDGTGGVYIGGWTQGNMGGINAGSADIWLARFDNSGTQSWIRQIGSVGIDYTLAAATDGAGGVYLSGLTEGNLAAPNAGPGFSDIWITRYDQAGTQKWIRQAGTPAGEESRAAAPDGSGGVYVTGWTGGSLGGPYSGIADIWLARYISPPQCPPPGVYCTAKVNSIGCTPAIASTGSSSATTTSGFDVTCAQVRNNKPGVLMYSVTGRASLLFQGGVLCVANPIRRTPPVASGGSPSPLNDCSGIYSLDMSAFAAGTFGGTPEPALRIPGTVVDCQWWGRDFGAPFNTTLSDALEYTVCL